MYDIKDIEIKGEFGEKYRAKLLELNGDFVRIRYEDLPDVICTVPIDQVYYAQFPNQSWQVSTLPELIAGAMIDVLLPSDQLPHVASAAMTGDSVMGQGQGKPRAWWPAILKKRQGDLLVVELLQLHEGAAGVTGGSGGSTGASGGEPSRYTALRKEIVEIDLARFRCEGVALTKYPLKSFRIEIPDDMRNCFNDDKYEADLKRWCGDPVTFTKADNNSYILVMSTEEAPIHRAKLICKKWVQQWADKYELTQQVEGSRYQMQTIFEDEFSVDQELLGFALGADYANLKMVSQLPDVVSAQLIDQKGKFSVVAKTQSGLEMAREKLEIFEDFVEINKQIFEILLSENYAFLNKIVHLTGLFRMMVIGNDIEEKINTVDTTYRISNQINNDLILISLTGTRSSIDKTREMLHFAAFNFEHILEIKPQLSEIDNELLNDIRLHTKNRSLDAPNDNSVCISSIENGIEDIKINGHKKSKTAWKE